MPHFVFTSLRTPAIAASDRAVETDNIRTIAKNCYFSRAAYRRPYLP